MTDLQMPKLDGYQLTQSIRALETTLKAEASKHPNTLYKSLNPAVIFVITANREDSVLHCLPKKVLGYDELFNKPAYMSVVIDAMKRYILSHRLKLRKPCDAQMI